MSDPSEKNHSDQLERFVRQAESEADKRAGTQTGLAMPSGARIGFDFVAVLAVFGVIGWGIDAEYSTGPWGLTGMSVAGFIVGILRAWQVMQRPAGTK